MTGNIFSGGTLDRASLLRREAARLEKAFDHPDSLIVLVWRAQILTRSREPGLEAVLLRRPAVEPLLAQAEPPIFLGLQNDVAHFALDVSTVEWTGHADLIGEATPNDLRLIGGLLPRDEAAMLAYARGMTHWHRTHRFCGRCGSPTHSADGGHVRRCSAAECATDHFPRTDPAVIMLVSCGDHCLLGRQAIWPPGVFSTLAGFVEPGETPEEAVIREVMEETGVAVHDVRYHSSQPWPFPASLMLGFMARAESLQAIAVDHRELEMASWFSRAELADFAATGRSLPRRESIARRLVEDWIAS